MEEKNIKYYTDIINEIDRITDLSSKIIVHISNITMKNRLSESIKKLDNLRRKANDKLNILNVEDLGKDIQSYGLDFKSLSTKDMYKISRKFYYAVNGIIKQLEEKINNYNEDTIIDGLPFIISLIPAVPSDNRMMM